MDHGQIQKSAKEEIHKVVTVDALEAARVKYLGRKGIVTELFAQLIKTIAEYKLPYTINNMMGKVLCGDEYLDEVILVPLNI